MRGKSGTDCADIGGWYGEDPTMKNTILINFLWLQYFKIRRLMGKELEGGTIV